MSNSYKPKFVQMIPAIKLRRTSLSDTLFYFDKNARKDAEKVLKSLQVVHGNKAELVMVEESQNYNIFSKNWGRE